MSETVQYVYCVVPSTFAPVDSRRGIDDAPLRCVAHAGVAAIVSAVDKADYSGDAVSQRTGDPEWIAPRAVVHDAVITWAADRDAVVPFPMWVMFRDDAAIMSMLETRAEEFRETLNRVSGARELCVRVFASQAALANAAERLDEGLMDLARKAEHATPGQAYLLRRKLAEVRKSATRDAASRIAELTHSALSNRSRESLARSSTISEEPGVLLDAAYLVADEEYDAFRAALTDLVATYEPTGLRFDFTGPWPPYHFVRGS